MVKARRRVGPARGSRNRLCFRSRIRVQGQAKSGSYSESDQSQVGISPKVGGSGGGCKVGTGLEQGQDRAKIRLKRAGTRLGQCWGRDRKWIKGRLEA